MRYILILALALTACASTPPRPPAKPAKLTTWDAVVIGATVGLLATSIVWQFTDTKTERAIP